MKEMNINQLFTFLQPNSHGPFKAGRGERMAVTFPEHRRHAGLALCTQRPVRVTQRLSVVKFPFFDENMEVLRD